MIRTQVYLDEDVYQQIRLQAQLQSQPAASLIRKYLRAGAVKSKKKWNAREALLLLAKHAGKGGPADLSKNLDDYLYGDKK